MGCEAGHTVTWTVKHWGKGALAVGISSGLVTTWADDMFHMLTMLHRLRVLLSFCLLVASGDLGFCAGPDHSGACCFAPCCYAAWGIPMQHLALGRWRHQTSAVQTELDYLWRSFSLRFQVAAQHPAHAAQAQWLFHVVCQFPVVLLCPCLQ